MHNSLNPFGGANPLIDKMIGNAYEIVKYVAKYLREIRYVAENMQYVYAAANGSKTYLTSYEHDDSGSEFTLPAPAGYDYDTLRSVDVIALTSDGRVYFPGSDTFTYYVDHNTGSVVVTLNAGLPLLGTAQYRVTYTANALPVT